MSANAQAQTPRVTLKKALTGLEGMEVVAAVASSSTSSPQDSRNTDHPHPPESHPDNVVPVPRGQADSLIAHETIQRSPESTHLTLGPIQESHAAEDSTRLFNASDLPQRDGVANPRAEVEGAASVYQGSARNDDLSRKLEKMFGEAANRKVNGADAESKQSSAPSLH